MEPISMRPCRNQLGQPRSLRSREAEVQPRGDAVLEEVKVLRQGQHRLQHVQAVDALRIDLHQRLGQEVGLLLVVAFEADAVAGRDHGFEQGADGLRVDVLAGEPRAECVGGARQPGGAVLGLGVPVSGGHVSSLL